MYRRIFIFALIFLIIFNLSGCIAKSMKEIESEEYVSVCGIDEEDGKIKMTIALMLIKPTEGESDKPKVLIYTSTGDTVFDALRNLHAFVDKHAVFEHNDYYLIGEKTAKNGINQYLDFVVRDHEPKQNAKLIITHGSSAEDLIKSTNFKNLTLNEILSTLFKEKDALSQSCEVSILDYMRLITNPRKSLYTPCIHMVDRMEKSEEDKDKKDVELKGIAVFEKDELVGYLNGKMARGANWVIDEIESGVIVAKDKNGKNISLEIISNKPKIKVDYSKDKPTATIKIEFSTVVSEYQGEEDIFKSDSLKDIIEQQDEIVKKEIEDTIEFLQDIGTDILGMNEKLYHKYPKKTDDYDEKWSDIFNEMEIEVEIESNIERTYNINQPLAYEKEEKK